MSTPIGRSGLTRINAGVSASLSAVGSAGKVVMFDDFLGDVLADQWNYVEGTDASPTDGAVLAGGIGGVVRMSMGDAGTGLAADQAQLTTALQWQASNGGLAAETRVKISALLNSYLFFGFTDQAGTLEGPVTSAASVDTITTNASDAVGIMYDNRMTTKNFWGVGVKGDVDAVAQNLGVGPVADTYARLGVFVDAVGRASFSIDGVSVGTVMLSALTPAADLTPVITVANTSGTVAKTADVDYVAVSMNRGGAGVSY